MVFLVNVDAWSARSERFVGRLTDKWKYLRETYRQDSGELSPGICVTQGTIVHECLYWVGFAVSSLAL